MSAPIEVLAERATAKAERKGAFGFPSNEFQRGAFLAHLKACPTCNEKLEKKNAR